MAFFVKLLQISVTIVSHPAVRYAFQKYTGKPLSVKGAMELFQTTRYYAILQRHAEQAAKGVQETYHFDPKNPAHYKPVTQENYNPFTAKLKALKSGFTAAKEAVQAEAQGKEYKPSYPQPNQYKVPNKPITKNNRLIQDH
jgi:hypothetical protein